MPLASWGLTVLPYGMSAHLEHDSRGPAAGIGATQPHLPRSRGITLRAILIGMLLMPINAYWIIVDEVRWYTLDGTCLPLFITPIFMLFLLCAAGFAVRRFRPSWVLDQGELLAIYVMLVIGCVLAGHDLSQNLFGIIAHADRYNTPERRYSTFLEYLKPLDFLLVQDKDPGGKDAIKAFYQGGVNWRDPRYLYPFLGPLAWWTLFLGALIGMCLCISILIRKAWTENEKLAFPIVQLPLAMTNSASDGREFWKSRMMWGGFAVAAAIDFVNGMHYLYPSWPYLEQVKQYELIQFLNQRPWNAMGTLPISMYPFAIGLAYFMPLDLAFSCWFFYVARKAFQVVGAVAGWDTAANMGFPYFENQASGAWIALGAVILWALRGQFVRAWRAAFTRGEVQGTTPEDQRGYRVAFIGLAAGIGFLGWFTWVTATATWVSFLFFGLFFLLAVAMTRVRAELGTPHEIYFVNPRTVITSLFGVTEVGPQNLTTMSVLYWYNRCYRNHPMPNHIEAFRMAEGGRMQQRRLVWLIVGATLFATVCAFWANLHVTFDAGATGRSLGYKFWLGFESFDRLAGWMQTPEKRNTTQMAYTAGGALMVLGLRVMRGAFLWWPFHPAGYALAVSFAMDYFWFAFFVSWFIKALIVRFGGMKAHNSFVPFFMGLILGDYVFGALWAIYGPANGLQVYRIFI